MRGIVISPSVTVGANFFSIDQADFDPQLLRTWLLFWDRLDFPDSNIVGFGLSDDANFLVSAGVMQRTAVRLSGSFSNGEAILKPHVAAFEELNAKNPGSWSIAQGEGTLRILEEDLEPGRGLYIKLMNAIPVPDKDIPLSEILEFKSKRASELDALHHEINSIYQRVLDAPDRPLAENEAIKELGRRVEDQLRVAQEFGLRQRFAQFSANFDLLGAVGGLQAAASANLNAFEQ